MSARVGIRVRGKDNGAPNGRWESEGCPAGAKLRRLAAPDAEPRGRNLGRDGGRSLVPSAEPEGSAAPACMSGIDVEPVVDPPLTGVPRASRVPSASWFSAWWLKLFACGIIE